MGIFDSIKEEMTLVMLTAHTESHVKLLYFYEAEKTSKINLNYCYVL